MNYFFLAFLLLITSCTPKRDELPPSGLRTISLIDRNGITQTISERSRLIQFEKTDFTSQQPYQKVLRIYHRNPEGNVRAVITTYHPNGEPKQLLEVLNSRAFGPYKEWHENGILKIDAFVIGGEADIDPSSEKSWLFDGKAKAWNEEGNLEASLQYAKGVLDGESFYYHENGAIWKHLLFKEGKLHGTNQIYLNDGTLLQSLHFEDGLQHSLSFRYWCPGKIAAEECYAKGRLISARYFDQQGILISEVVNGKGEKALFGKNTVAELREIQDGREEGKIQVFLQDGTLARIYHAKNGVQHGEERYFFPQPHLKTQTQLLVNWYEGALQGVVKSWFDNGQLESEREMSQNKKNGLSTAWYRNGNLMLIEEYEENKLLRGEYYKKGEKKAISTVKDGNGIVTLFDGEGHFLQKIRYEAGEPKIDE